MMKSLLSIDDLDRSGIIEICDLAESFLTVTHRDIPKVPALRGKTVASVFYEESTRTRLSFETAAKRLSADVMTMNMSSSSVKKGESLRDTVQTIEAMGVDAMVIRHSGAGAPNRVATWVDLSIVNAGDGRHEHPTQALLDVYTARRHLGADLSGARIAIVGDIRRSRVARSTTKAFAQLGAKVTLVAPPTMLPDSLVGWPVVASSDFDSVLPEVDLVYLLRIQHEREDSLAFPSLREYTERYGLTRDRADRLRPEVLIMHPGPMNRGVEIAPEVAESDASVITEQVENGVAVRMAVLYHLLGSGAAVA